MVILCLPWCAFATQARTYVPFRLRCVTGDLVEQAQMLGTWRVPWNGCTSLWVTTRDAASISVLPSIFAAAADWPNLQVLRLSPLLPTEEVVPLPPPAQQQQQGVQQGVQQQGQLQQQQQQQEGGLEAEEQEALAEPDFIVYTAEPGRWVWCRLAGCHLGICSPAMKDRYRCTGVCMSADTPSSALDAPAERHV
jgi:hypothetical protein